MIELATASNGSQFEKRPDYTGYRTKVDELVTVAKESSIFNAMFLVVGNFLDFPSGIIDLRQIGV